MSRASASSLWRWCSILVALALGTSCRKPLADGLGRDVTCHSCHGSELNDAPPRVAWPHKEGKTTADRAIGAHAIHLQVSIVRAALGCNDCHIVPETIDAAGHIDAAPAEVTFGELARASGAAAGFDAASGTCTVYCHGITLKGGLRPTPAWTFAQLPERATTQTPDTCVGCHGAPPPAPHPPLAACNRCHGATVQSDGSIDVGGGKHINGVIDVAAGDGCDGCHDFPPVGDAHAVHVGVPAPTQLAVYGDVVGRALGSEVAYGYACGTCHPRDAGKHMNGVVEVELFDAAAPPTSPKGRTPASAVFANGTCADVYCHSSGDAQAPSYAVTPAWAAGTLPAPVCAACHTAPPPPPHPASDRCAGCHADTAFGPGAVNIAGGKHVNARLDVVFGSGACGDCHAVPPRSAAHVVHYGDQSTPTRATYGGLGATADVLPSGAPYYAFDCGNCHPTDSAAHMNGTLDVRLAEAGLPAGALKARNAPGASYTGGHCDGVYCHSSGQEVPSYVQTPAWVGGTLPPPRCAACHGNPPRYASGGAGTTTANSHLQLTNDGAADGNESGHFAGLPGPHHLADGPYHGASGTSRDAAPITCQTCHFETVDPDNVGAGGFYYLDTTGNYDLGGTSPYACATCHKPGGAATGSGRVQTRTHVNGVRDVVFDPRTELPSSTSGLPSGAERPRYPYWVTLSASRTPLYLPPDAAMDGGTWSAHLAAASYDPLTKTCAEVTCHVKQSYGAAVEPPLGSKDDPLVWGMTPLGRASCAQGKGCHQY